MKKLLSQGATVIGISRRNHAALEPGLVWSKIDLSEPHALEATIRAACPSVVFHLSSLADGCRDMSLVMPTFKAEALSSISILMACLDTSVKRIVFAGSFEEPINSMPPSSPYAAAKITSRNYGRMFHLLYGTPVVLTRLFMCYGPGQPDRKVIPSTILSLLKGERPVVASPDREVDWIFVSDAIAGLIAAARTPMLEGKSIDIGSGELVTIRQVVENLRALINPGVEADYASAKSRMHEQVQRADVVATLGLTGWRTSVTLDAGLMMTTNWFKQSLCKGQGHPSAQAPPVSNTLRG